MRMIANSLLFLVLFTQTLNAQEKHLKNIRQLTFGGDNAEAYFSPDGKNLSFQSNNKNWGLECDQIFDLNIEKAAKDSTYIPPRISNGLGRTTCSYYMPNGKDILFASTFKGSHVCPQTEIIKGKYLWGVFGDFDIYIANKKGKIKKQLTQVSGYDAEATVSPKGDKIVFTSTRSGDLELWTMNIDGTNQQQITNQLGYDGGAFFSPDGQKIVYRASRPTTEAEIADYKNLLARGLVAPTNMEIYTCNVDGSDVKKITNLGKANWAPFFHPSGKKIIFSSNHGSEKGFNFQLYSINTDGTGLEQITSESNFNAFPMFSPDGKKLIFSSNRNNHGTRDTNLFIADWED
ncbi:MAG: PD40 domain-containing protein [Bacteroidetes bacterium]|jgi:TolB protein|nr:PD40 domain-containing protein [Bacteroidota bacterium]MBK6818233.1 PD40 domain-containing protein [Bacteroidota bacterium]MBK7040550.1 PD40 domain-containing protein [Bacteroidota bacterium]MBK8328374.1 PD40 domain-containing protein [Bacteroidota bacterium]MBK9300321.1 PD40 domain-containing protein [Bacteroidota bacterium]